MYKSRGKELHNVGGTTDKALFLATDPDGSPGWQPL